MKKVISLLCMFLVTLVFVNASSIFLSDHLEEGETKAYETDNGVYVINLLSVADVKQKATFRLNDEMSKGIKEGDSYVFKDGSEIVVRELIITETGEGNDEAYYYFYGTGEGVLPLKNVSREVVKNNLCNFDGQCLNETKENCCYDCGCGEDRRCENNKCVLIGEEKETKEEEVKKVIEEEQEEVEVEEEMDKEDKEKKASYYILGIMLVLIVFIIWIVYNKRKSVF